MLLMVFLNKSLQWIFFPDDWEVANINYFLKMPLQLNTDYLAVSQTYS